ncbi:MAG: zinc ribbon domain-containing protein [Planctomycetes bacterium]|nr:zinc ribbon domain-containing protein [Planctomycetota bacterium]
MPLFDYQCEDCQKINEILIRGKGKPKCPDCGSKDMTQKLPLFAVNTSGTKSPAPAPCGQSGGCSGGGCPMM